MLVAVSKVSFGCSHGYKIYDSLNMSFVTWSDAEIRRSIKEGLHISGLMIDKGGDILIDIMYNNLDMLYTEKGLGVFTLEPEDYDNSPDAELAMRLMSSGMYFLTRVVTFQDGEEAYEVVTHDCARLFVKKRKVLALLELDAIAGLWKVRNEQNEEEIIYSRDVMTLKLDDSDENDRLLEEFNKKLDEEGLDESLLTSEERLPSEFEKLAEDLTNNIINEVNGGAVKTKDESNDKSEGDPEKTIKPEKKDDKPKEEKVETEKKEKVEKKSKSSSSKSSSKKSSASKSKKKSKK